MNCEGTLAFTAGIAVSQTDLRLTVENMRIYYVNGKGITIYKKVYINYSY
jgi:hypothetical protein